MKIELRAFSGEIPRLQPHLLPALSALEAKDTKLYRGAFEPFKEPQSIATLAKSGAKLSLYRFGKNLDSDSQYWFHFLADADVTSGAIQADPNERTYFTEAGQLPRVTDSTLATVNTSYPADFYTLGLPAPAQCSAAVSGVGSGVQLEVVAAYSYVSAWGEEGPLSQVSSPVTYQFGQTLDLTAIAGAPVGDFNVATKRIYVSATDVTGATLLRFWAEIAVAQNTYSAQIDNDLLGEAAPSPSPIMPPADLFGIQAHPNGFLIGFSGKNYCRSEVFKPYAWPNEYRDPVDYDIVGGAVIGQSVVICTKVATYLATGLDPLSNSPVKLEGEQPCVSKRSIKSSKYGVIYASPDGLVAVSPAGTLSVITEALFTRDQWQAFNPSSMHAEIHEERYFCWWSTGPSSRGLLIFDFSQDGIGVVRSDIYATAAYSDPRRDELFLALPADNNLYKWDAGATAQTARWRSRRFILDRPQNLGAAKIIGDIAGKTLTFRLYADGVLKFTTTVISNRPFRMTSNYRAREYEFELEGDATVREVHIAGTIAELVPQ